MKLSVGMRIGGGFLLLLVFLVLVTGIGAVVMKGMGNNFDEIDVRFQRFSLDYQINQAFQGAALAIRGYMVYGDEKYLNQYRDQMNQLQELFGKRINNSSEQNRPKIEKAFERSKEYDGQITQNMVPLLKEKKMNEATAVGATIAPITAELNGTISGLIKDNEQKSKDLINKSNNAAGKGRFTVLAISVIALLVGLGLAFFVTRSITSPIRATMNGIQLLADGDFTQNITVKAKDEIGELVQAVNRTREQLKKLVGEIVEAAKALAAHSQELAASAEEVSATVEEVASTTNEVAAMAEKSLENANETLGESRKVVEVAESGGKTVKQTVDKITSISESTARVNDSIQDLGELSTKIGNITDVITGIADQTNLLALNAAIEAARAGEQGRGFAVVAEEVRKLAEQSADAAREISQLINHIRSGVDTAIRSMEQGTADVNEGVGLASDAGNALQGIIQAINQNIVLVEEITLGARQTSEGTQQLSASNEQVTSTIQQVAGATQELADIANKLQTSVARFKV